MEDKSTFYTMRDVCKMLNASPVTVSNWLDKGYVLRVHRLGKSTWAFEQDFKLMDAAISPGKLELFRRLVPTPEGFKNDGKKLTRGKKPKKTTRAKA